MNKFYFYTAIFLLCAGWLASSYIRERSRLLKEADRNLRTASDRQLEQYRQKLLMFRKSLPVIIMQILRKKTDESGNEEVENMLRHIEIEFKRRQEERQEMEVLYDTD